MEKAEAVLVAKYVTDWTPAADIELLCKEELENISWKKAKKKLFLWGKIKHLPPNKCWVWGDWQWVLLGGHHPPSCPHWLVKYENVRRALSKSGGIV